MAMKTVSLSLFNFNFVRHVMILPTDQVAVSVDDIQLIDCTVSTGGQGQCSIGDYSCLNGNCVDYDSLCDFVDNCGDTSDETSCPTYQ